MNAGDGRLSTALEGRSVSTGDLIEPPLADVAALLARNRERRQHHGATFRSLARRTVRPCATGMLARRGLIRRNIEKRRCAAPGGLARRT
jgi:hypothetical protein